MRLTSRVTHPKLIELVATSLTQTAPDAPIVSLNRTAAPIRSIITPRKGRLGNQASLGVLRPPEGRNEATSPYIGKLSERLPRYSSMGTM